MNKIFVFFLVAAVTSSAFGKAFRRKRQSDNNEDGLDDRYGFDRRPWQNQNQFPWQNQNGGNRPWQNQNQNGGGQFPWQNQNQNGGQGQSTGQNQNQNGGGQFPWQNQNQNGGQGQFPGQNQNQNQNGGQGQNQNQNQRPNGNGGTSNTECLQNCPVTSEYNPVCGTDNVTYTNPGRLGCAQACGVTVSLLRSSPCPTSTQAPST